MSDLVHMKINVRLAYSHMRIGFVFCLFGAVVVSKDPKTIVKIYVTLYHNRMNWMQLTIYKKNITDSQINI